MNVLTSARAFGTLYDVPSDEITSRLSALRLSVGLEDADDILGDLEQALMA